MTLFYELLQKFYDRIGRYQLSIAGEIVIGNKNNTQLLTLNDKERCHICNYIDILSKRFPFLTISHNENLVEISIKIFAYNKYMDRENFLEELRSELSSIICEINKSEHFHCRLSVTGTIIDKFKKSKFVMLSKQSIVEYKLVYQEAVSGISKIMINKMVVCGFILIALLMIADIIYMLTFVIQDHDPNRLLSNILGTFSFDKNIFELT